MHLGCNVFVEIKGEYLGNRGFLLYQLGKVEQVRACVGMCGQVHFLFSHLEKMVARDLHTHT